MLLVPEKLPSGPRGSLSGLEVWARVGRVRGHFLRREVPRIYPEAGVLGTVNPSLQDQGILQDCKIARLTLESD